VFAVPKWHGEGETGCLIGAVAGVGVGGGAGLSCPLWSSHLAGVSFWGPQAPPL
jgi:hypothetical protein